jgi:hypothetical protein
MENRTNRILGKTTATYNVPNTVDEFYFWIDDGKLVQPYDFVTAVGGTIRSVAIVTEISLYTDAQSHLANRIGSDLENVQELARLGARVARANVFYTSENKEGGLVEERLVPMPSGVPVYMSTPEEVEEAMFVLQKREGAIPAGVMRNSIGENIVVLLDADYLLGPQSAHANVSGITGLATKTSYMMFLLYSVNQIHPNEYINIIFNVKQADLMKIEDAGALDDRDKALYKLMFKTEPEPFKNVQYYQPSGKGGKALSYSSKIKRLYNFILAESYRDLDLLFADVDDSWHTVASFSAHFIRDWDSKNQQWVLATGRSSRYTANNWEDLRNTLEQHQREIADAYHLQYNTVGRITRELTRLTDSTVFVTTRGPNEFSIKNVIKNLKPGETIVIDIAKLPPTAQTFVVGNVFRELENTILQETEDTKKKAIVIVDELNSLAPSSQDHPIKQQIVEVARKGRSAGFIIFGAEQFASEVDDQIVGNSALRVFGRTSAVEANTSAYRNLTSSDKNTILRLKKGEMLLSYPTFRTNIRVYFPKPPYKLPATAVT